MFSKRHEPPCGEDQTQEYVWASSWGAGSLRFPETPNPLKGTLIGILKGALKGTPKGTLKGTLQELSSHYTGIPVIM